MSEIKAMSVSEQAIEAAAAEISACGPYLSHYNVAKEAIEAALPFLAPIPRQSDEERARRLADDPGFVGGSYQQCRVRQAIAASLAAVRAEERESCAKEADSWLGGADDMWTAACISIASAIRARPTRPCDGTEDKR